MGQSSLTMESDVIKYFRNTLITLEYIHRNNVIHCNLKPNNIFVNNGDMKILDFLLASSGSYKKSFHKSHNQGEYGALLYAPEIKKGKSCGPEADIYSIGWVYNIVYNIVITKSAQTYDLFTNLIQNCMKELDTERISAKEALGHTLFKSFLPETFGFSQLKKFESVKGDITLEKYKNTILILKDKIKIKIEETNPPKTSILGLQKKNIDKLEFYINDEELDIHSGLNKYIDLIKIAFDEIQELSSRKDCLRKSMKDQEKINTVAVQGNVNKTNKHKSNNTNLKKILIIILSILALTIPLIVILNILIRGYLKT